ncbi:MAG: hypothetical protein L3K00_04180 [Thermoplasmata archaeon]|nr:hypothetical protein [Thermoplasmata archaeon]
MSAPSSAGPPAWASRGGMTLDRLAIGMFVLLAIEFVLGMALALLVGLPTGAGVVSVLASAPVLDLHIVVALLLVGISLRALALARADPDRWAWVAAGVALGSALLATGAGWTFAFDGQAPVASLVMAVGFLGVLFGAFLLRGRTATPLGGSGTPASERPR